MATTCAVTPQSIADVDKKLFAEAKDIETAAKALINPSEPIEALEDDTQIDISAYSNEGMIDCLSAITKDNPSAKGRQVLIDHMTKVERLRQTLGLKKEDTVITGKQLKDLFLKEEADEKDANYFALKAANRLILGATILEVVGPAQEEAPAAEAPAPAAPACNPADLTAAQAEASTCKAEKATCEKDRTTALGDKIAAEMKASTAEGVRDQAIKDLKARQENTTLAGIVAAAAGVFALVAGGFVRKLKGEQRSVRESYKRNYRLVIEPRLQEIQTKFAETQAQLKTARDANNRPDIDRLERLERNLEVYYNNLQGLHDGISQGKITPLGPIDALVPSP